MNKKQSIEKEVESKIVSKDFLNLQIETYKNIANNFDKDQKRDNRNHLNKIKAINKFLKIENGEKVLEIGIGTGIHAKYLLEFNQDKVFDFYGIDISQDMLNEAKNRLNEKVKLISMVGEDLKFENNFFDKIYISGSLHHFSNPELGINELFRVLKSGGKFCIMEPNILFPTNFIATCRFPEEIHMRLMKRGNFKKWLNKYSDVEYDIINFAYTPPFPKSLIGFFDIIDKILFKIPILKRFSVMLFVKGCKKWQR
jgi:demethylmenaquinone methyltransferase/2-methoxy-6-polyprenyl-1,4-benzoquinol methylase